MDQPLPNKRSSTFTPRPSSIVRLAVRAVRFPLTVVRRLPFSLVMIGLIVGLAVWTGSIHGDLPNGIRERWGYDLENLRAGHVWVILSSEVLTLYPDHVRNSVLMLLAWLVPLEFLIGTWRTLLVYWTSTIIASGTSALLALVLIWSTDWDEFPDLVRTADVGASVGGWGVAGALSIYLLQRGRFWRAVGFLLPLGGLLYLGQILIVRHSVSDIAHPLGMAIGMTVVRLLQRAARTRDTVGSPAPAPAATGSRSST